MPFDFKTETKVKVSNQHAIRCMSGLHTLSTIEIMENVYHVDFYK
jgi:hypothetical protein